MNIVWTCSVCGQPVDDGDGWVAVDVHEAIRAERQHREWDQGHTGSVTFDELSSREPPAHWLVLHAECDPLDERGPYSIEVQRIRTAWDVLAWTSHLVEKTWVAATDWRQLINDIAKANGSQEAH